MCTGRGVDIFSLVGDLVGELVGNLVGIHLSALAEEA